MASDGESRRRRLATLTYVESTFHPLPVDGDAARAWAGLVAALREAGRRAPLNDTWIAAVALAREFAVVTQDSDYDEMPGVHVIRV
jgi:hypothetical protein